MDTETDVSAHTREIGLTVVVEAGDAAHQRLEAVLGAVDAQSVLIRPAPGRQLDPATAKPLIAIAQKHGAAALVANDSRLARTLRADGVHLDWSQTCAEAYAAARDILGQGAIVGCDAGRSRHDAMELAEAGADYVGFSRRDDAEGRLAHVDWWSEIFEVPVVAFDVGDEADAAELGAAGADFIGVGIAGGEAPQAAARRISACLDAARRSSHS